MTGSEQLFKEEMPRQQEASFTSKCFWTAVAAGAVGYAIWEVCFIIIFLRTSNLKIKNMSYLFKN
jgi:hypothetical protein